MAISKAKKSEILSTLEGHLKGATSIGFTSNKKVTVAEVSQMKKELRSENAIYMIAKKTLICIAFKNVYNVDLDINTLPGQVAVVISKGDKIAGLAVVNKFAKEWKKEEKVVFVGGYLDGRVMDSVETSKLAGLPSREVLLAKLLGSMMSPLSGLARFFDGAKNELEGKGLGKVGELTKISSVTEEVAPSIESEATPAE